MATSCLPVGSPAPAISLRTTDGQVLRAGPPGMPRVLAFVHDWRLADEHVARLRALLRGLGAEMTVLSPAGVWSVRPDDPVERLPCAPDRLAGAVRATARLYDVPGDADAVFVIDEHDVVAFAHAPTSSLAGLLAGALGAAADALHSRTTPPVTFTRRAWATSCLVTGFAVALFGCKGGDKPATPGPGAETAVTPAPSPPPPAAPADLDIVLHVNGTQRALTIDPRTSLLDALRERLGLVGTKKGCDGGQCGACTVHVGGRRVVSCLTLAAMAQGQPVTTIEGLGTADKLHPMQAAFIAHDGFQCGFCTPGQIMSAVALLEEKHVTSDAEIRESMSGNLCRCGAYPNIVAAIRAARGA